MKQLLIADTKGTALIILATEHFDTWLAQQSTQTNNWLNQTSFKGEGLSLIPNNKGELEQVVFVVNNPEHYFACGELIKQLPTGQYLLQADEQYQDAICFAWLAGSYQFDRYKSSNKIFPTLAVERQSTVDKALKYAEATRLTRDLVNTPAADMMPENLGKAAVELTEKYGGKVTQIIGDDLLKENYPTIML